MEGVFNEMRAKVANEKFIRKKTGMNLMSCTGRKPIVNFQPIFVEF